MYFELSGYCQSATYVIHISDAFGIVLKPLETLSRFIGGFDFMPYSFLIESLASMNSCLTHSLTGELHYFLLNSFSLVGSQISFGLSPSPGMHACHTGYVYDYGTYIGMFGFCEGNEDCLKPQIFISRETPKFAYLR